MQIGDSGEFVCRLDALAELFEKPLTPAQKALYFEGLRDIEFADIAAALNAAVKACTFMPKPAELRKLAVGDADDLAEAAWLVFRKAMRQVGAYASIATSDPALGETVLAMFGGWAEACRTDLSPEMWSSKRKEFGRIYRVMRDRALAGSRYLAGLTEAQNSGRADWLKFVEVALLDGHEVKRLTAAEGDVLRQQLAAGLKPALTSLRDIAPPHRLEGKTA